MQHKTVARAVGALLFVAGAGVAAGAFGESAQQGFYGVVKAGAYYIDNPLTVGNGQPKNGDSAFRIRPELNYVRSTQHFDLDVHYTLDAVRFSDTEGLNSVQHQALGRALWKALPDWLSFEVRGSRVQQALNPVGPANLAGILGDSNRIDLDTMSFGPQLRHRFSSVTLQGHYNVSRNRYNLRGQLAPGLVRDADDQDGYLSVGTMDTPDRFGWQAEATHQRTTYGSSGNRPFQYDRVKVGVAVPVGGRWSLIASAGMESDMQKSSSKGGLDSANWEAGIRWSGPQSQSNFEVAAGHRYFGNSLRASFARQSRMLKLAGRYVEEPTTDTYRLSRAVPSDIVPGTDFAVNAPFLLKEGMLSATITGSRTSIELGVFDRRRDFSAVAAAATATRGTDVQRGAFLRMVRQLNSRTQLVLDGGWDEIHIGTGAGYQQTSGGLELVREFGRGTEVAVGVRRWERTNATVPYQVTAGYLQVAKKF